MIWNLEKAVTFWHHSLACCSPTRSSACRGYICRSTAQWWSYNYYSHWTIVWRPRTHRRTPCPRRSRCPKRCSHRPSRSAWPAYDGRGYGPRCTWRRSCRRFSPVPRPMTCASCYWHSAWLSSETRCGVEEQTSSAHLSVHRSLLILDFLEKLCNYFTLSH